MNRVKRGAFLTMDSLDGFFCSDHLTIEPLSKLGWRIDEVSWKCPGVRWGEFDLVVIRSPWDYSNQPQAFMSVLEQIDRSGAHLANPLDVVRWNLNKSYLKELEAQGISIVPTLWPTTLQEDDLKAAFEHFSTNAIVVKPVIGANARDTFRLTHDTATSTTQQAIEAFRSHPAMLQPFVRAIVDVGEYSLFYFSGEFSHCVLKTPQAGDFRVQEEHGGLIRSCPPPPLLLEAGERVMNAIGAQPLYARVDFVYLSADFPVVIELELIEPSLYFTYDERSPDRFAHALDRMYRAK